MHSDTNGQREVKFPDFVIRILIKFELLFGKILVFILERTRLCALFFTGCVEFWRRNSARGNLRAELRYLSPKAPQRQAADVTACPSDRGRLPRVLRFPEASGQEVGTPIGDPVQW
jgi:hypothetical protein